MILYYTIMKQTSTTTTKPETTKKLNMLLSAVTNDTDLHQKWLNTLAFLEHIGSRKIIKSSNSATLNKMMLQHISEEARHAWFFKSLISKVNTQGATHLSTNTTNKTPCPTFETQYLLKGSLAEDYFQAIDHKAEEELSAIASPLKNFLNYLYTTWMIEQRAMIVYQNYNTILKTKKCSFNLQFVLQEEDHHLQTVIQLLKEKDADFNNTTQKLFFYEEQQFNLLLDEWLSLI